MYFCQLIDLQQLMNMNRPKPLVIKLLQVKNDNHCEYFQTLQQKLLQESQKMTRVMSKPHEHSRSKPKIQTSSSRTSITSIQPIAEEDPNSPNSSDRITAPKVADPPIKRAKHLCELLRKPKTHFDQKIKFPSYGFAKQHDQPQQKPADTLSLPKQKEVHKQKHLPSRIPKSLKIENLIKRAAKIRSLKQTISTESCKSSSNSVEEMPLPFQQKTKLIDFEIIKYLGEGRLGTVYLVRHKRTGFICAMKRIQHSVLSKDCEVLTQRIREIKIQSFLDHPNIIQLYCVFVQNNDLYLLMQLCSSGSVQQLLKQSKKVSEEKIRGIVKQICHALQFMHQNDILHRDIKPENIIFHQNVAKICDFGWSVYSPLLRQTRCGSPLYTSPEIVQKQQYDNKIDVWNVGILTYELLMGKAPFDIRSEDDLSKVIEDDIYFPRSRPASAEIKNFILCCLSKNPKERHTIFELMDHQFLNVNGSTQQN